MTPDSAAASSSAPDSFPRLSARTRRWTLGVPRSIAVTPDGSRILFLRSMSGDDARTGLWAVDVEADRVGPERLLVDPAALADAPLSETEAAHRERIRETASGVVNFSVCDSGALAVALVGERLLVIDTAAGAVRALDVPEGTFDARIDPTGRRAAVCIRDGLGVIDLHTGRVQTVAGEPLGAAPTAISWGRAEHVAAEEMNRPRGHWWSPDGRSLVATHVDESMVTTWWISAPADPAVAPRPVRYPPVGSANAAVTLWRIDLADDDAPASAPVEIRWDRNGFEYLAAVHWGEGRAPIIGVQSRDQRRLQWREAVFEGSTSLLAEDTSDRWVELHPGNPTTWAGQLVRIADVDGRRRLLIGDAAASPAELHVRAIVGATDAGVLVTASAADPAQITVHLIAPGTTISLGTSGGVATAAAGGEVTVVSRGSLVEPEVETAVLRSGRAIGELRSVATPLPLAPEVDRWTTTSGIRIGLVLPREHRAGARLPVLLDPYGGPGAQQVLDSRRHWQEHQWWADQGFAVVVADGPGTPGGPVSWEHAIAGDLAGPALQTQVEALQAAADRHSDLDTSRVAIRGWSFGGFLAALAVLHRPDMFHVAVAGAPVIDWRLYDTHYTERYLGTDPTAPSYAINSLLDDAAALSRPLLLIHGFADDNVVVAHTLQMSQRLTEAGRPHTVLPLSGVTHMTPQESIAENLLLLQRDFIRRNLPAG
jgi:dipeptidyl-peptidase-4